MTTNNANPSVPTNELNAFAAGWMDKLNGKPCAPPDGMARNLAPEYRLGYGVPRAAAAFTACDAATAAAADAQGTAAECC